MSKFMASQEARISKFEADFKQKQSEMTNKIDTLLKVLNDREMRALPSYTAKNPKLNVDGISYVTSPSSCPQYYSVNAMSTCFKETQVLKNDQQDETTNKKSVNKVIETPPIQNLDDEFKSSTLNVRLLMY